MGEVRTEGWVGACGLADWTLLLQVEHILRDENMMAAQEVLELFYEFIAVRLPIADGSDRCTY